MDTEEKVTPKRGRPKKIQDAPTPMGEYIQKQAEEYKESKSSNPIVEKYYRLVDGHKLCLIKVKKSGRELSEYVGSIREKKESTPEEKHRRSELLKFIKEKEAEGKLKRI